MKPDMDAYLDDLSANVKDLKCYYRNPKFLCDTGHKSGWNSKRYQIQYSNFAILNGKSPQSKRGARMLMFQLPSRLFIQGPGDACKGLHLWWRIPSGRSQQNQENKFFRGKC